MQIRTIKVAYTLTSAFVGVAYVNEISINARYGTYKKACVNDKKLVSGLILLLFHLLFQKQVRICKTQQLGECTVSSGFKDNLAKVSVMMAL